jgi:hypothetical protein
MRKIRMGTRGIVCLLPLMLLSLAAQAQHQCYAPRENQDGIDTARWAYPRAKMLEAEKLIHANAAFRDAPVPVRTRSTLSTTRLHVRAYPEKSLVGIQVWEGECNVIPQAERIDASIGVVSVFFNHDVRDTFFQWSEVPKLTGHIAGYPEYNGAWVVITKDGRLPWIPQTLADRLDREGKRREEALAEWRETRAKTKVPDEASLRKTRDMLAKTDPEGARKFMADMEAMLAEVKHKNEHVYPSTTARLEKEVQDYKTYRASFSAEDLARPAAWSDPTGAQKRELDARLVKMKELPPQDQQNYDKWTREARDLDREARALDRTDKEGATRLRARSNELALQARDLRKAHQERSVDPVLYAMSEFALYHIKPGDAANAIGFKPDPTFPDPAKPNQIQLITVSVSRGKQRDGGHQWMARTKDTLDWKGIAALLD